MIRYIAKRLIMMVPVMLGIVILVFTIMYFTPGDPTSIILEGKQVTEEARNMIRAEFGLDKPYFERLFDYLLGMVRFDLGTSYVYGNSVSEQISIRFPYTLTLALISTLLAIALGVPLGINAGINHRTWKDSSSIFASLFFVSMPNFWFSLILVRLLSVKLKWLPATGVNSWTCYIMPCVALCLGGMARIARQTRAGMLDVIRMDYIKTAKAKGQSRKNIVIHHAMKNALVPIIQTMGTLLGNLLSGAVVIETIFGIPGLGSYMVSGIKGRDVPVVQGSVLVMALCFSLCMLLIDIIFAIVDPRIRSQYIGKKKQRRLV